MVLFLGGVVDADVAKRELSPTKTANLTENGQNDPIQKREKVKYPILKIKKL
jgi:hypothetical protein